MKIVGTGLTGLVGSRIIELLPQFEFENLSRKEGVDILDYSNLFSAIKNSDADLILHLAAYTDVKAAEVEKDLKEESQSWKINVEGTRNVVKAAEETDKKIIYFSTDMVVGGEEMPEDGFKEDASYYPLSWYAITKAEGEKIVKSSKIPWVITRIAYPYRARFEKLDFVRLFINKLQNKEELSVLSDRIISPTFIDDIAQALDVIITKNQTGIFNVVGSSKLSIYDAAFQISEIFNFDSALVKKTTREEFLKGRPPEPFSSALNNDKIKKLGAEMKTFQEGLIALQKQL